MGLIKLGVFLIGLTIVLAIVTSPDEPLEKILALGFVSLFAGLFKLMQESEYM